MRVFGILSAVVLASAACTGADAEDRQTSQLELITYADPEAILDGLKRARLSGEIGTDSEKDPIIRSTDKSAPFSVRFYDCSQQHENCSYIQFTRGWDMKTGVSLAKIEAWNEDNVWGQAYRDEDEDPWLALTVNFEGGISPDNLDSWIDWWKTTVEDYEKHIGWNRKG